MSRFENLKEDAKTKWMEQFRHSPEVFQGTGYTQLQPSDADKVLLIPMEVFSLDSASIRNYREGMDASALFRPEPDYCDYAITLEGKMLGTLETAISTQNEISLRGWNALFVKYANTLDQYWGKKGCRLFTLHTNISKKYRPTGTGQGFLYNGEVRILKSTGELVSAHDCLLLFQNEQHKLDFYLRDGRY